MSKNSVDTILKKFLSNKIIPVFYHDDIDICKTVLEIFFKEDVTIFEFTNRGENALKNFEILQQFRQTSLPDLQLGAGTIKNETDAENFINAGASFIVSPVLQPAVALYCSQQNVLHIPGCITPTEIQEAINLSAVLIKLFPANFLSPSFLHAIKPVFPNTFFMPTGGIAIEEKSLAAWFNAGVSCIGFGSNLITNEIIKEKNWNALKQNIQKLKQIITAINAV